MRHTTHVILFMASMSVQAAEYSPPVAPAEALPAATTNVIFIPADAAQILPMAEWEVFQEGAGEQAGERILIREGPEATASAPADASKYEARTHKYPVGAVRILSWEGDTGPVVHQITFETELFVLQGEVDVDVGGETVRLYAGDAVFLPSGTLRNMNPSEDTVIAQYFVGFDAEAPESKVVRGKNLSETKIVQWMDDGVPVSASTDEEIKNASPDAAAFTVKRYLFDGNSIRYAKLSKGGTTNPATYQVDVIIYIVKGHMRRTEGDQVFEVSAGDSVRETKDQTGYWELLEDSVFIATNAPLNPAKAVPSP